MNAVLCGMMGCGKTTVAAQLSELLGVQSVDIDKLIEERYGSINAIFAGYGEERFRDIETEITAETAKKYTNAVISLGGGCVLRQQNVKNLKATGKIIYLRAQPGTLIDRLRGDNTRPLLHGGLEERVHTILSERAHLYESVSDFIIDTDGLTPLQIAQKIEEEIL